MNKNQIEHKDDENVFEFEIKPKHNTLDSRD
jgi:hypothetical protein